MGIYKQFGVLAFATLLIGCVNSATYTPPSSLSSAKNTFTINKSYDETYSSLVAVLAGTFFAIDNFDKGSGLITLSYVASGDVSKYIDCGRWTSTLPAFNGKYEDYLVQHFNGELSGRLNIVVKSAGNSKTTLIVNSRYTFDNFTFTGVNDARVSISNSAIANNSIRICRPTGYVERLIADQISNL